MQEEMILEAIRASTRGVFSTMLEKDLVCETPCPDAGRAERTEGVMAQISVVGSCSITCLICCSAQAACSIAAILLMQECPQVEAEVLDAIAEMANMILGSVKTDLVAHLGDVNLSIPTVMYGQNFKVHSHNERWTHIPFLMDDEQIMVKVCFGPPSDSRKPSALRKALA